MGQLLKYVFVACLVGWPLGWWKSDRLPATIAWSPTLDVEPRQEPVRLSPIDVSFGGVDYRVEPLYRYALDGVVVSYRVHDADHLLHRLWHDHLNVADVCVVWGHDAHEVDLHAFEFENGEFTCMFRTRSDTAWRSFRLDEISNNHLITADSAIRSTIGGLTVGDRIHFEGYLANYSNANGFHRGTSTTRTDTGNGACETTYVTAFDIADPAPRGWRKLSALALWGMLMSGATWVFGVAKGWF